MQAGDDDLDIQTPRRRVYKNPYIRSQICAYFQKGDLARIARVDKAVWPDATKLLYRKISSEIFMRMTRVTVSGRLACDAVRIIDLIGPRETHRPYKARSKLVSGLPDPCVEEFFPDAARLKSTMEKLRAKYHGIEVIRYITRRRTDNDCVLDEGRWTLTINAGTGRTLLAVSLSLQPCLSSTQLKADSDKLKRQHEQLRATFRIHISLWIVFARTHVNISVQNTRDVLTKLFPVSQNPDTAVVGIECHDNVSMSVVIERLKGIESYATFSRSMEIYVYWPLPVTVEDIRQIASYIGFRLTVLVLFDVDSFGSEPGVDMARLPEVACALRELCPHLRRLSIGLRASSTPESHSNYAEIQLPSLRSMQIQLRTEANSCLEWIPLLMRVGGTAAKMSVSIIHEGWDEDLRPCLQYFSRLIPTQRDALLRTRPDDLDITHMKQYMDLRFDENDRPIPLYNQYATNLLARLDDDFEGLSRTIVELKTRKRQLLDSIIADDGHVASNRISMEQLKSFEKDVEQLQGHIPMIYQSEVRAEWESLRNRVQRLSWEGRKAGGSGVSGDAGSSEGESSGGKSSESESSEAGSNEGGSSESESSEEEGLVV